MLPLESQLVIINVMLENNIIEFNILTNMFVFLIV